MRFSLQVQYAICGVFDLAYNSQGERLSIQTISERQSIPARYLEQIFQRLRRGEIVTSKRGPGGGYALSREPDQINLRQIVEAIEGPLSDALEMARGDLTDPVPSRPDFLWKALAERLALALEEITLEILCREAALAEVERAESDGPMYFI